MNKYTWDEAKEVIDTLNKNKHEGHENWRLPSIEELFSIIDYTKTNPASKLSDMLAARYWSSTTDDYYTYYAWYVNFRNGYDFSDAKTYDFYVRPVRTDEDALEWGETL